MEQTTTRNRYWNVKSAPEGFPTEKNISLEVEEVPAVTEGTFLVKINVFSLDPYMRGLMNPVAYGVERPYPRKMSGGAVGEVVESKHAEYQVGEVVLGDFGWQEYALSNGKGVRKLGEPKHPLSLYLGVLGMPGSTAYFGFLDITKPQPGETVVVSTAAGAVGAVVGQIAKIKGCRVVGIAGGPAKCQFAKENGYDECVDYLGKTPEELKAELSKAAPSGYNIYFDNTGGTITDCVLQLMASRGRVSVCGQISLYNASSEVESPKGSLPATWYCLRKQLRIEGFYEFRWAEERSVAWGELGKWLDEGKIKVQETTEVGIENAFKAFLTLFRGSGSQDTNSGKLVVKVSDNSKGFKVSL